MMPRWGFKPATDTPSQSSGGKKGVEAEGLISRKRGQYEDSRCRQMAQGRLEDARGGKCCRYVQKVCGLRRFTRRLTDGGGMLASFVYASVSRVARGGGGVQPPSRRPTLASGSPVYGKLRSTHRGTDQFQKREWSREFGSSTRAPVRRETSGAPDLLNRIAER